MTDLLPLVDREKKVRLVLRREKIEMDHTLLSPTLVKIGRMTGKQVLMTPKRASRLVRSATMEYIFCELLLLMRVVTHMRIRVTTQILRELFVSIYHLRK